MPETMYEFEQFFNRAGFNKSLGHFQVVSNLLSDFESKYNLADMLNSLFEGKEIRQNQLNPIVYALLADKYGYAYKSHNMPSTIEDFDDLASSVKKWKAVDMVLGYHHPELGFTLLNPKNAEHWKTVQTIKRNELITVYAGGFADQVEKKITGAAIQAIIDMLNGKRAKTPDLLLKGKYAYKIFDLEDEDEEDELEASAPVRKKAPGRPKSSRGPIRASSGDSNYQETEEEGDGAGTSATATAAPPQPAAPQKTSGARRMTPMYSVPVTNELFHNGNVEAWKKIIASYETKFDGCEVSVFYEGEKIHDLNTLFKWGKVKHGSTIMFAILGTEILDVAKLQRYLRQGASHQFEAFLKFPVNTVLKLF